MGFYSSGQSGVLVFDGRTIAKISSWSLQASVAALETTSLSDTAKTYTPGIKAASGSCSVWMYRESAQAPVAGEALISKVFRTSATSEKDIYGMSLMYQTDKGVKFNCIITDAALSLSVGEIMQVSLSFQVTSDLIEVKL
jgi:hypothetical protein